MAIVAFRHELEVADTLSTVRLLESQAAAAYWAAWRTLPITFPRKDLPRVAKHWLSFGTRKSPLTGSPRLAVTPPGAILNYCYALLESEARLAAAALGLDPGMGMLHVDTPNRDSLACDIMEAVRPSVDAWLLNWITREPLRRSDFFEDRNGNCRLIRTFAASLSETAPTWGRLVAPWAEYVAHSLRASRTSRPLVGRGFSTPLTQAHRRKAKSALPPDLKMLKIERICHGCGARTRVGSNCPKCGREISRDKLIEHAKAGRMAALRPEARRKHSETQRKHEAAKRAWRLAQRPNWPDEKTYVRQIQPRLGSVTISTISSTLGVCESYAADIRAGRHRPHPRHWEALARLGNITAPE